MSMTKTKRVSTVRDAGKYWGRSLYRNPSSPTEGPVSTASWLLVCWYRNRADTELTCCLCGANHFLFRQTWCTADTNMAAPLTKTWTVWKLQNENCFMTFWFGYIRSANIWHLMHFIRSADIHLIHQFYQ